MKGIKHLVGFTTFNQKFREIFKFNKEKKKTTRLCADINEVYFFILHAITDLEMWYCCLAVIYEDIIYSNIPSPSPSSDSFEG